METTNMPIGIVTCSRLNIYSEPNFESEIVCKAYQSTEAVVDLSNSTEDFYKVYTAIGAEGFCQKDFMSIK